MDAFDVAATLLSRANGNRLSALKLQKLTFYSFGWFAHLTGERLFKENFFALPKGPIVSELYSAHSGQDHVTLEGLQDNLQRSLQVQEDYAAEVIDAVFETYGRYNQYDLVEMTHLEQPWRQAWHAPGRRGKSAPLPSDHIVDFFLKKSDTRYALPDRTVEVGIKAQLPSRRFTQVSWSGLQVMMHQPMEVPESLGERAAAARRRLRISA
ncbi:Panacea domain-containing protein [Arthrobacter sp. GCM10027362]|uniref:Panacea domain-containing protein n=1 Tax=Arthrobacter sp. GCM10027362 TaxID=3273379 RepID=UPI0036262C53